MLGLVFGMNAIQPHTFLEQEGLLVGKDLFTVRSRAGFIAEYPQSERESTTTTEYVEQGKVWVSFGPNLTLKKLPQPPTKEISCRNNSPLRELDAHPATHLRSKFESLEQRLDILNQRQKELINRRDSYLREETKTNGTGNSEYCQLEKKRSRRFRI